MHHKRGKKKSARAGCSMCKPHKDNEFKNTYGAQTNQEKLARDTHEDEVEYTSVYGSKKIPGGNGCSTHNVKVAYYETFDAFYCPNCKEWTENKCGDQYCEFCKNRPEKAL